MKKIELKRQLNEMGIKIIEGGFVQKKDIKKALSVWKQPKPQEIDTLIDKIKAIKYQLVHLAEDRYYDDATRLKWDKANKHMDAALKNLLSSSTIIKTIREAET